MQIHTDLSRVDYCLIKEHLSKGICMFWLQSKLYGIQYTFPLPVNWFMYSFSGEWLWHQFWLQLHVSKQVKVCKVSTTKQGTEAPKGSSPSLTSTELLFPAQDPSLPLLLNRDKTRKTQQEATQASVDRGDSFCNLGESWHIIKDKAWKSKQSKTLGFKGPFNISEMGIIGPTYQELLQRILKYWLPLT